MMKKEGKKGFPKPLRIILAVLILTALTLGMLTVVFNVIVLASGGSRIRENDKLTLEDPDCILILGCSVKPDGSPSDMLRDRLDTGIALYKEGAAPKLLMSGDSIGEDYDEVGCMKAYAESQGVPSEDILTDPEGICTYDSVTRAKRVFGYDKMIIVTQKYHLYRACHIANCFDIECEGASADLHRYRGQTFRDVREIFGRCKDLLNTAFKPEKG